MPHNGLCKNILGKKHQVLWDFHKPELEGEHLRLSGKCLGCDTEFQQTYEFIGNSIISKKTRVVSDFNYPIIEPQFDQITSPTSNSVVGKK